MKNINEKKTDYLVKFHNAQKFNEASNGTIMTRGFQEHRFKIVYPLHITEFDAILDDDKKDADTSGEYIICGILYLENSEKSGFLT